MTRLADLDGEARAVRHIAAPLEFAIHVAQIVANAIDLGARALVAIVAVLYIVAHALEVIADAIELVAHMAAAAGLGFVVQVAVPFPEAVHVGAEVVVVAIVIVVVVASLHRRGGEQGGGDAEGEDDLFHKGLDGYREE